MKKLIALFLIIAAFKSQAQEIISLQVSATDSIHFIMHPTQLQVRELHVNLDSNTVLLECRTFDNGFFDTTKYKSFELYYVSTVLLDIPTYQMLKQAYKEQDYATLNAIFQIYFLRIKHE